jgi:hypothetical protein
MSEDSGVWEPELLESQLHGHDPENELPDHPLATTQRARGPKWLPVMWSRVISIADDGDSNSQMMELFFRDLATRLDHQRP